MQILCTIFIAISLLKWTSAVIPSQPCKLDPWTSGKTTNPAAKLRLNQNGIDLASSLTADNVTKFLKAARAPDAQVGDVTVSNTHISRFEAPNYYRKLVRPNTIQWGFNQAQLSVFSSIKRTTKMIGSAGSQTVQANITVTSRSTSMETLFTMLKTGEGRPTVTLTSCTAKLAGVNIASTGSPVLITMVETYKAIVVDQIQRVYQQMVCGFVSSITKDINAVLKTYSSRVKLEGDDNLMILDYSLIDNPKVANNDQSIEGMLKGAVYYRTSSFYPFYPPAITETSSKRMLDFYMTDYVFNTLLFTAYKEKLLRFEATANTSSSSGKYLALSCSTGTICVRNIFPKAFADPNSYVKVYVHATESPKATFVDNDAYWTGEAKLQLEVVDSRNKTIKLFTASSTCMYGSLTPKLSKSKLYAITKIISMPFSKVDSPTKDLNSNDVKNLQTIFTDIFEEILNGILSIGFSLPSVEGVSSINSSVQLLRRTLYVGSDVIYS